MSSPIRFLILSCLIWSCLVVSDVAGQPAEFNYDESLVPHYDLPDPLQTEDGQTVGTATEWWNQRRGEILELFQTHVYGATPSMAVPVRFTQFDADQQALEGRAIRKQITATFGAGDDAPSMDILIYLPADSAGPVPVFVGLNFGGNQTVQRDPAIRLSTRWMRDGSREGVADNRATEASRGTAASRWPVAQILQRGYGVATIYCGDLDPDFDDGFQNGVHPLFYHAGQTRPLPDQWGTIGAWAWGLSRAMDYFETDPQIDSGQVIVMGHSRLGKTALWAGAQDQRFAIVISNDSGCGGAALSRRRFGETVKRINDSFPHWFCDNFTKFNDRESDLPVDQHMLIALIAPRPVLICSATEDLWADPRGEFLSGRHADPVYRLLGTDGMQADDMPEPSRLIASTIGYHLRPGKHDVTLADWTAYCDFADRHLPDRTKQRD